MDKSLNCKTVNLNILQWNAQSVKPKLMSLEPLLTLEKIHIVALSETWLNSETYIKIKDYNIYRNDRDDSYGGVAVLAHKSIKTVRGHLQLSNDGIEAIYVKIFNCQDLKNIVSIYCPSSVRTCQRDWDGLFSTFSCKTVIIGDFNAHHSSWSYKTDNRGSQIFDALLDTNFVVLNNGESTRIRFVNGVLQASSPDLSLITPDIVHKFNWKVLRETLGSDHLMIKISALCQKWLEYDLKRNFKKANWDEYKNTLEKLFDQFPIHTTDLQKCYNIFLEYLNLAADIHIPFIKINKNPESKFLPKTYWDVELSKSVAIRRQTLARFRRNSTPQNLAIFQEKVRHTQKLIRQAKLRNWERFCDSVNEKTTIRDMWKRMRWMKGFRSHSNHHLDKEKAEILLHSLAPDFVSPEQVSFSSSNMLLEEEVSIQELDTCIKLKDTSPGCDGLTYSMLKHLPFNGKCILIKLYNAFLKNSFVPSQWRDIGIIAIPKPGRDINDVSSLRPISLMSCLCKILHLIIKGRLEWFLEKNKVFSSNTFGFRRNRSCLDSLSSLVLRIQIGFSENQSTIGCFLDLDNAYNNVEINELLYTLDQLNVGTKICQYLSSFLNERHLKIYVDNMFISRFTGRGLAQGDPLSPLLFNVATLNICKSVKNVYLSQYADDFVIYKNCDSISNGVIDIQLALNTLNSLFFKLGLEISSSKSKVCIFKNGRVRENINITVNKRSLKIVESIKYLGLCLDRSLRWAKHINEIKEKAFKFVNILKILIGSSWGVHPVQLRRLYIAIIRSRLDYASFLFDNSHKTHLTKLDVIQNQCMRLIGGFVKTTPIHVMESELLLQPLFIRRRYLAGKFWLKCRSIYENIVTNLLCILDELQENFYWRRRRTPMLVAIHRLFKETRIYSSPHLEMFSVNSWISKLDLSDSVIPEIEFVKAPKHKYNPLYLRNLCHKHLTENFTNYYKIYTDGSKDKEGTGAAFLDIQTNEYVKLCLGKEISVMHAELIAIAEALSYVKSLKYDKLLILTDSRSALQHLKRCTSLSRGFPLAYDILSNIVTLKSNHKRIVLQWVPSHIGLEGNEAVDVLAKEAISDGENFDCVPYFSELLSKVRENCREKWSEYFDERSLSKGIWYKTIQPHLSHFLWFEGCNMGRQEIITAMRLRSGHIPLNKFAFMMRKVNSPNCVKCGVVEDTIHIMMECERNEAYRKQLGFDKNSVGLYII